MSDIHLDSQITKFKETYLEFLKQNINYTTVNKDIISVTTPFLDRHNDYTEILIIDTHDGSYRLTDDGYTINDLELSGFDFNTPKRKTTLLTTASRFGVSINEESALEIKSSLSNMPLKKHMLLQCMVAVNELFMLSKGSILSYFIDDVVDFFEKNEIRYTKDINIIGKS